MSLFCGLCYGSGVRHALIFLVYQILLTDAYLLLEIVGRVIADFCLHEYIFVFVESM